MMDLTVAVISYNTKPLLRRCLASLAQHGPDEEIPILVIDNASDDGSPEMVSREFGHRVTLLANRANLGFARAVNQALSRTTTRYLLVLNADTEVDRGSIEALHAFMDRTPDAGVAGGRLQDAEGRLQPSCRRFYTPGSILLRRTPLGRMVPGHRALREHLMLDWDHAESRAVDWIQGACLMLRCQAMEQVGGMDERFFLYFEDVDLCRRMAEAGWVVYYVPQATFVHHYQRESHAGLLSKQKLHHLSSGIRYLSKWRQGYRGLFGLCRRLSALPLLLWDLVVINGCFLLALYLRDLIGNVVTPESTQLATYAYILAGANGLLLLTLGSEGLYRVERSKDWLSLWAACVKAVGWVALAGIVVLFFAPGYRHGFIYSRLVFLIYLVLLVAAVSASRLWLRSTRRFFWRRHLFLRRVLVVGEPGPAHQLADAIRAEPITGYQVAAVLEDSNNDGTIMEAFEHLLARHSPAGVVFVAHQRSFRDYVPMVLLGFRQNLEVRVVTSANLFPYIQRVGEIAGQPAADVTRTPLYPIKRLFKRVSDSLLSLIILAALSPLLLLLALLIRLYDGGPALYVQTRVGKNGRRFRMIKLRTMRPISSVPDEGNIAEGPMTRIPNDPRVTPLGRWLRRHKLDELPQLLNVLSGQMSLVGPRPPMEEEVKQYTPWQRCRLAVRPGITGPWQIDKERKWRFDEMVELDLQYILNWSMLMDYSIMLRTIPTVLRGS